MPGLRIQSAAQGIGQACFVGAGAASGSPWVGRKLFMRLCQAPLLALRAVAFLRLTGLAFGRDASSRIRHNKPLPQGESGPRPILPCSATIPNVRGFINLRVIQETRGYWPYPNAVA